MELTKDRKIELLTILVDGCKRHPAYRAIRPAAGKCEPCVIMWKARSELLSDRMENDNMGQNKKSQANASHARRQKASDGPNT